MIAVTLGPDEIAVARLIGDRRYSTARAAGSAATHYEPEEDAVQDHHAAGAEIAACIALGGWWDAIRDIGTHNRFADLRVGRRGTYQVRSTRYSNGFMPIYTEDNGVFVFVVGELPTFQVIGLIDSTLVKREERWYEKNPRTGHPLRQPCFIVEQRELEQISEIAR